MSEAVLRGPTHPRINAADVALNYAKDVLSGAIVAGKLVKLAAKRFLRDLKYGAERGLSFDPAAAQHVVDFFGFLRHSKGEWGKGVGEVFTLSPWQVFILANIFGWKRYDGTRRFREVYIEVARKNGKSTFVAGIGLYMLVADNEPGAEVYTAATKKDQAKIVFEEAERMRKKSEFLRSRIENPKGNMHVLATDSKFEPLSSEDDTLDGLNAHGVLIDELHAHPSRKLYDVLQESIAARRQPLVFAITTAGYNRLGICYKQREIGENILVGITEADKGDSFFAFIACMDEKGADGKALDWADEKNWPMANPNIGVSVKWDYLREKRNKAEQDPTSLNSFLRKHLNVWTSQEIRWMPPDKWAACNKGGAMVSAKDQRYRALEKLVGRFCYGGLDLSSKIDLSAFVLIFPPIERKVERRQLPQTPNDKWARKPLEFEEVVLQESDPYWYVIPYFFVPEGCVDDRTKKDKVPYDVWVREGFIETTPGNAIDQQFVRSRVNDCRAKFDVEEIGFDNWNASQLSNELLQDGAKLMEVRMGFKTMSEPMKELMALVVDKKIEHFGNPVLSFCLGNTAADQDPAGNIKPDKERSKEKIDGTVALVTALQRVVANPSEGSLRSPYNDRGIVFL